MCLADAVEHHRDVHAAARWPSWRVGEGLEAYDLEGLQTTTLIAGRGLLVAVGAEHRLAGRTEAEPIELAREPWIVGHGEGPQFTLWPGLEPAPVIAFAVRDWPARFGLVAGRGGPDGRSARDGRRDGRATLSAPAPTSFAKAAPQARALITVCNVKPPMPRILRRGAVIRVAGAAEEPSAAAPAYAISFVDLRFDDGHVERWLGAGALRDEDAVAYGELVAWGHEVAEEHSLIGDLGMAFSSVDRGALADAPVEIAIEWNAKLPDLRS
jgi:hypothetical protein